jgi:hypothetical protein
VPSFYDTATPDIIIEPVKFEPTCLQLVHANEDELVLMTHKHPVALDMGTYKPDGIFPYAYITNHQARSMHVHGIYGQRCTLDYFDLPGLHACMRGTSFSHLPNDIPQVWPEYFHERSRGYFVKEKIKHMRRDLFLFLPIREHVWEGKCVHDMLTLKCLNEIGWECPVGPPSTSQTV